MCDYFYRLRFQKHRDYPSEMLILTQPQPPYKRRGSKEARRGSVGSLRSLKRSNSFRRKALARRKPPANVTSLLSEACRLIIAGSKINIRKKAEPTQADVIALRAVLRSRMRMLAIMRALQKKADQQEYDQSHQLYHTTLNLIIRFPSPDSLYLIYWLSCAHDS